MSTPTELVWGVRTLNGAITEAFNDATGLDTTKFQDVFAAGRNFDADGNIVEYDTIRHDRGLAPVVGVDGRAVEQSRTTRINRSMGLIDTKEYVDIPASKLWYERAPGELKTNAAQTLRYEVTNLMQRLIKTREYACSQLLTNSTLTISAANIPGSTQSTTIAYAQNTDTATSSWATAGTDIVSVEIPLLQLDAVTSCGFPMGYALTGRGVLANLMANTEIQTMVSSVESLAGQFLASGVGAEMVRAAKVAGLEWDFSHGGYVPAGGSFTEYATADRIVFMPRREQWEQCVGLGLGYGLIPANVIGAQGGEGLVTQAPQRGIYGWAELISNPLGIRLYMCDRFIPIIQFPEAVLTFDTTP